MNLNQIGLTPTDNVNILLGRLRAQRDRLLSASDWAMMPDAPTDKRAWAKYRQALRDLPDGWEPAEEIEIPEAPDVVA